MNNVKKKIVIVDDEAETLEFVGKILKFSNYETYATPNGQEAVGLVKKVKPDLIMLDMLIPDMKGEDIALELAQNEVTSNIPIIFMTGLAERAENVMATIKGRYSLLVKPIIVDDLLAAVKKALAL
jgi:DNA-binding response OmpR family regulator